MPALPKYSSTHAWKAVPFRADMPGSRGTGLRSRQSTAEGSSPRSTRVDAEMWVGVYGAKPTPEKDDAEAKINVKFEGLKIETSE